MRLVFIILLIFLSLYNLRAQEVKYSEGYYITKANDTVRCQVRIYKKKERFKSFVRLEGFTPSGDSINFGPKDVKGYYKEGGYFLSFDSKLNNAPLSCFLKKIEDGKIELFELGGIPDKIGYRYFFRFKGSRLFYVLNPDSPTITEAFTISQMSNNNQASPDNQMIINLQSTGMLKAFKEAMGKLLKDCELVRNKISNDYYDPYSLNLMIREYNSCNK